MAIFTDLPGDLVEEILCRVPATSLKRLRTTCKLWNHLFINDMGFARKHSDKAAKESLFLMLSDERRIRPMSVVNLHGTPSVEFKSELSLPYPRFSNSYQVFHCDGLLLCFSGQGSRIVVWNPCTAQTKWIEARVPLYDHYDLLLGYYQDDNKTCGKSYKILKFNCLSRETEVYEFNSGSWRILDYNIAPGWSLKYFDHVVSLKGKAYMFATDKTDHKDSLLRFDFSTEKSQAVPFPYQWHSRHRTALLSVVREEKLSMLLQRDFTSKSEIWVTNKIEETRPVSWTKVLAFDLSSYAPGSFLLDEEKKVLVWRCMYLKHVEKIYIVGVDNEVTQVDAGVVTSGFSWSVILNYVPSLVQMEHAGGNKRKRDELSDCVLQVKSVPKRKRPFRYVFFGRDKSISILQFQKKKRTKKIRTTLASRCSAKRKRA